MEYIEPSVELYMEEDPVLKIERISRVCTKSESNIKEGSAEPLINKCIKQKHNSIFGHYHLSVMIHSDVDIHSINYILINNKYLRIEDNNKELILSGNIQAWRDFIFHNSNTYLECEIYTKLCLTYPIFFTDIITSKAIVTEFTYVHDIKESSDYLTLKITTDRGCCYDDRTMVLTTNGWKYFPDVTINDYFYTLDDIDNLVTVPCSNIIKKEHIGKLHYWGSSFINLAVTPNHNLWIKEENSNWEFVSAYDASIIKKCSFSIKGDNFNFNSKDRAVIKSLDYYEKCPIINEKDIVLFYEFIGIWLINGSIMDEYRNNTCLVSINCNYSLAERIKFILIKLKIDFLIHDNLIYINSIPLFKWLKLHFVQISPNIESFSHYRKNVGQVYRYNLPRWIHFNLNKEEKLSLLKGMVGDIEELPHDLFVSDYQFALDVVELCLQIGYHGIIHNDSRIIYISQDIQQYKVSITKDTDIVYDHEKFPVIDIDYKGYVYCVELPMYHKLYVMRNNKSCWCGNSHEIVRHRVMSYMQECIIGDTIVHPDGLSIKELWDLQQSDIPEYRNLVKDLVINSVNDKQVIEHKVSTILHKGEGIVFKVTTASGVIYCTDTHRFLQPDMSYVQLKYLGVGDKVLGNWKNKHICSEEEILSIAYNGVEELFDIEMEKPYHNYIANGFVVHNSTRYVNYNKKGLSVILPKPFKWAEYILNDNITSSLDKEEHKYKELADIWKATMENIEIAYNEMISQGASPQEARAILPNSLKTDIYVTGTLSEWQSMIELRDTPGTHPQYRILMEDIKRYVNMYNIRS
jgi:hypothetical protein